MPLPPSALPPLPTHPPTHAYLKPRPLTKHALNHANQTAQRWRASTRYPATVYNDQSHKIDLYGDNIEVDYRGYDVNVENFVRVLTGRFDDDVSRCAH